MGSTMRDSASSCEKSDSTDQSHPSLFFVWWTATRPHTLTASLCPCIVSWVSCNLPIHLHIAWTFFCVSIQIGTNLHNDYADYCRGADTNERVGHARATARGWLTPRQTCVAATMVLCLTLLSGIYVVYSAEQSDNIFLWIIVATSIFNAFAYTGGPYPLGYLGLGNFSLAYCGLGDIFVFLYFGLVATCLLPYLQYLQDSSSVDVISHAILGTQVGLLATNILVVNNLRDRNTDSKARKLTTSVRFGRRFSLLEYRFCQRLAYTLLVVDYLRSHKRERLLPFLSYPWAKIELKNVSTKDGGALNPHVGGAAKVQLLFCCLIALGRFID